VVSVLAAEPHVTVKAATRRPDDYRAPDHGERVIPVPFDWDGPAVADAVVAGVDTLLVLPPPGRHPLPAAARLLDAAAAAGVGHVVFVSTFGAGFEPGFAFGRWARAGEQATAASGLPYTVLRPNSLMANFLSTLRPGPDGALRLPWGSGATSFVDPADVAAVAARVLLEPRPHAGRTYGLTGPEALDVASIAATMRAITGEPVHYVDTPADVVRAYLAAAGMPEAMVTALMELHGVMSSRARAVVTGDVELVIGRPPRSFADFMTAARALQPTSSTR